MMCSHTPALATLRDTRDIPLRAQSVCLAERPRSKYVRAVRSADPNRQRYSDKKFIHRQSSNVEIKRKQSTIAVKPQNRRVIDKTPCAVAVQTLSIPMKYADNPKPRHSTSKAARNSSNNSRVDNNKTKYRNPPKQVGGNKRLCHTIGSGKETENKLLLQIREADQVSDFERILNTNAILCERAKRHVWRGCGAALKPSASVLPRPRSAYSLYAVSQAYHYLFRQHEESLQPLIDEYRQATADDQHVCPPASLLGNKWLENLQDLSEFYEDDQALRKEVENITDRIVAEEVAAADESQRANRRNKLFNVNLAGLIGLHVQGEGCSPIRDDYGPSPDVEKADTEEEWLAPIMSANSEHQYNPQSDNVDCITQNLNSVKIDSDAKVPTITFSNCCDNYDKSDRPDNRGVDIHLAVPSIEIIDESRPPMM